MYKRPIFMAALVLILAVVLIFSFSPTVRAAVEAILEYNGVTVSVDEQTGKLVVSGNTDSIVKQSDTYVEIQGENGEKAGVGMTVAQPVEMVAVGELLNRFPDLRLPKIPAGYTIDSQVQLTGDDSLLLTWRNADGNIITYERSSNQPQAFDVSDLDIVDNPEGVPIGEPGFSSGVMSVSTNDGSPSESVPVIAYDWKADGYYYSLVATGAGLSEADLKAMLP